LNKNFNYIKMAQFEATTSKFFYIDSDSSKNFYPDNLPFNFSNQLSEPIDVENEEEWEVALHELHYRDDFESPPGSTDSKFFGTTTGDNSFKYTRTLSKHVIEEKGTHTIMSLASILNLAMKDTFGSSIFCKVEVVTDPGEPVKTRFLFRNAPEGSHVELNENLQRVLNQPYAVISVDSRTKYLVNTTFLESLGPKEKLAVKYVQPIIKNFTVSEPDEYTIMALMSKINDQLRKQGVIAASYYTFQVEGKAFLNLAITPKQVSLQMPPQINELLGLSAEHVIEGASSATSYTRYQIPVDLSHLKDMPHQLIVSSNVVKPCFIHGRMYQVLRLLMRKPIKIPEVARFESVLYQPLSKKHLDHITLTLSDSQLNPIKTLTYPTTALLEIRKRKV